MTQWVSQAELPSITRATRRRTSYLAELTADVRSAIQSYFDTNPTGEEVTLAVLDSLGEQRLKSISGGRSFGRVKQDVGLFVAQTLADVYGKTTVDTLRRDNRRTVASRRCRWPSLTWVNSFTPHRVQSASQRHARVLLDTGVVRGFIHGDEHALDLVDLAKLKGDHPVSLADGAVAELAAALFRKALPIKDWKARVGALDSVLDSDFPVAPGGKELAAFWSGAPPVGMDLAEAKAYYRAAWGYLRNVARSTDLGRSEVFFSPQGRAYEIRLDQATVDATIAEAGHRWTKWATTIGSMIRNLRAQGETVAEADLRELIRRNLMLDMAEADVRKLDLVIHILAKRALQAAARREPYNPKGKANDRLDLDMLFGIPLPAWVCTSDERFCRLVRSTGSEDRTAVMTPAELLSRLSLAEPG